MKLVLQRAVGDCGIAALATLIEQSYEDVYVASARVDTRARGKKGVWMPTMIAIGRELGVTLTAKRKFSLDDDEGLLRVAWAVGAPDRPDPAHIVAVAYGVVADPTDGAIRPVDEYLAREGAEARAFLELR